MFEFEFPPIENINWLNIWDVSNISWCVFSCCCDCSYHFEWPILDEDTNGVSGRVRWNFIESGEVCPSIWAPRGRFCLVDSAWMVIRIDRTRCYLLIHLTLCLNEAGFGREALKQLKQLAALAALAEAKLAVSTVCVWITRFPWNRHRCLFVSSWTSTMIAWTQIWWTTLSQSKRIVFEWIKAEVRALGSSLPCGRCVCLIKKSVRQFVSEADNNYCFCGDEQSHAGSPPSHEYPTQAPRRPKLPSTMEVHPPAKIGVYMMDCRSHSGSLTAS